MVEKKKGNRKPSTYYKKTRYLYHKELNASEFGESRQSDEGKKRVALIATLAIEKVKEEGRILFKDLKDYVDSKFTHTMMRRTYDVINILTEVGVLRKEGRWLMYDPLMLDGAEAA